MECLMAEYLIKLNLPKNNSRHDWTSLDIRMSKLFRTHGVTSALYISTLVHKKKFKNVENKSKCWKTTNSFSF